MYKIYKNIETEEEDGCFYIYALSARCYALFPVKRAKTETALTMLCLYNRWLLSWYIRKTFYKLSYII